MVARRPVRRFAALLTFTSRRVRFTFRCYGLLTRRTGRSHRPAGCRAAGAGRRHRAAGRTRSPSRKITWASPSSGWNRPKKTNPGAGDPEHAPSGGGIALTTDMSDEQQQRAARRRHRPVAAAGHLPQGRGDAGEREQAVRVACSRIGGRAGAHSHEVATGSHAGVQVRRPGAAQGVFHREHGSGRRPVARPGGNVRHRDGGRRCCCQPARAIARPKPASSPPRSRNASIGSWNWTCRTGRGWGNGPPGAGPSRTAHFAGLFSCAVPDDV